MTAASMKAIEDVIAERDRQREKWGDTHDDDHEDGSLATAAMCYIADGPIFVEQRGRGRVTFQDPWPWDGGDPRLKRRRGDGADRESLIQAAALLLAEIERLGRASKRDATP